MQFGLVAHGTGLLEQIVGLAWFGSLMCRDRDSWRSGGTRIKQYPLDTADKSHHLLLARSAGSSCFLGVRASRACRARRIAKVGGSVQWVDELEARPFYDAIAKAGGV